MLAPQPSVRVLAGLLDGFHSPGTQRVDDLQAGRAVLGTGQNNDRRGEAGHDLARGLHAAGQRHGHIHDDRIRAELLGLGDGLIPVQRLSGHFHVRMTLNQFADPLASRQGIVYHEYASHSFSSAAPINPRTVSRNAI